MASVSRVRIFMNPLDAKSVVEYPIKPGTRIIDWLQEYYPTGFEGSLRVFLTGEELPLDDLDKPVGEYDQVVMLVMPTGDPVSLAVTAVVSAVVGAAVGYVINLIFPPETPKGLKNENVSPTYDISATRNRARLNEPIAVHYGTVVYPPDFATVPYLYYQSANDDEYVDQLMCLGSGDYEVQEIFIGGTPVTNLRAGTVTYKLYKPSEHNQQLGFIAADITALAQGTENPFPFSEYVYTAPEVSQIELTDSKSDAIGTPQEFINGSAFAGEVEPPNSFNGFVNGIPDTVNIRVDDILSITGTVSNNVDMRVGSVVNRGDGTLRVYEQDFGTLTTELNFPPEARFTLNNIQSDLIAGPFRAQARGAQIDRIDIDVAFPGGLSAILPNGNRDYKTVDFRANIQEINPDTGDPIGVAFDHTFSITGKQRSTKRDTISIDVTPGSYTVLLIRETPYNNQRFDLETSVWARLKGNVVLNTSNPAYGEVTMMAIRIKASQGISQEGSQQIRVRAKRLLPVGESDNPITVIKDIFTNSDYGLDRTLAEMETAQINRLESEWNVNGPSFNGSFDQKSTGFEAMNAVASLAGAKVLQHNALTTVIADEVQEVRTAVFSTANIIRDTLQINYTFDTDSDFDGYEIEYRDADFNPRKVIHPETSINPEPITLFGCTDAQYAQRFAVYLWNVRNQRRKLITFDTELEGLIPRFGDRIGIGHPMPNWGASGVVVEVIDATTVRVDAALDWTTTSPVVIFRDDKGAPHGPYDVTQGATSDVMVLAGAPTETVYGPIGQEPSSYLFGAQSEVIKDFIVTRVSPRGEESVTVEAQVYDPTIYDGGPPHMGGTAPLVLDQSPFYSFELLSGQSATVSSNVGYRNNTPSDPQQEYGAIDGVASPTPVQVPNRPWELRVFGRFDLTPPPYEWVYWMPIFRRTDSNPIPNDDSTFSYFEVFQSVAGWPDYPTTFLLYEDYIRSVDITEYQDNDPDYNFGILDPDAGSSFPAAIDAPGEVGRIQFYDLPLEQFSFSGGSATDPDSGQTITGFRKSIIGTFSPISAGGWEIHGVYFNLTTSALRIEIVDESEVLPKNTFARCIWRTSTGQNPQPYEADDPRAGRVTRTYRTDSQTGQKVSVWEWASGTASPNGLDGGGFMYFLGLPQ